MISILVTVFLTKKNAYKNNFLKDLFIYIFLEASTNPSAGIEPQRILGKRHQISLYLSSLSLRQ